MNLGGFEKSPQVAPLLVRLYENQKVYNLAKDKNPLAKMELTGAVADLLESDLSPREQELLADVLMALIRQAERDLREALSERLSTMPNVPLRIILQLAGDDIGVASPVLRKSPVLSDLDLIYIVKAQGAEYWRAIAAREKLSAHLIEVLAETRDVGTAIVLSENDRIHLTDYATKILAEIAEKHENVAKPLLAREDLPEGIARRLYSHVGKELQSYIANYYGLKGTDIDEAVSDIFLEFSEAPHSEYMPTLAMVKAANRMAMGGMLNLHVMLDSLNRGQIANFIAMFARYTGLSAQRIHDFLKQPCPKGLAIACRAFGIQKTDFSRIYLLTHRMRSHDRIVNQQDMMDILKYFDKIREDAAMRIVGREAGSH